MSIDGRRHPAYFVGYGVGFTNFMDDLEQAPTEKSRKRRGPHPLNALTAVFVRNVKKPALYADGNGLYLEVDRATRQTRAKRWTQILVAQGRRRQLLGLGGFRRLFPH